ncbi:hypothetical protein, partial [Escherichia coli]|uniref:hypothetical protein n=1 Tax=Escherichia coli TaxID=562 RepID=UPI003BB8EDAA
HTDCPLTDFGGKTSIFSHPVYLFLRKFSLQDSRGGSPLHQTFNLPNRNANACRSLFLNNLKSVEFLMTHRNSLFDHEKSPRELSGDILEWFKGDITAWC